MRVILQTGNVRSFAGSLRSGKFYDFRPGGMPAFLHFIVIFYVFSVPSLFCKRRFDFSFPVTMCFLVTVMAQTAQVPAFLMCGRIRVIHFKRQIRPGLKVVYMMDGISLPVSPICRLTGLAFISVSLKNFPAHGKPSSPRIKFMGIMLSAPGRIASFALCHVIPHI